MACTLIEESCASLSGGARAAAGASSPASPSGYSFGGEASTRVRGTGRAYDCPCAQAIPSRKAGQRPACRGQDLAIRTHAERRAQSSGATYDMRNQHAAAPSSKAFTPAWRSLSFWFLPAGARARRSSFLSSCGGTAKRRPPTGACSIPRRPCRWRPECAGQPACRRPESKGGGLLAQASSAARKLQKRSFPRLLPALRTALILAALMSPATAVIIVFRVLVPAVSTAEQADIGASAESQRQPDSV